jgi:hypothetical protein
MHRIYLALIGIVLFLASCQKEKSLEIGDPAQGSLQDDAGDCLPKNIHGNYIVNQALGDSNYVDVTLDIVKAGTFTILTDTVNGYSFKGQGSFNAVGTQTIRIKGTGKPLVAGNDEFQVFFDSSSCFIEVNVLPAGSTPPPPSTGGVYFPLSTNSWWSYDDGMGSDTIKTSVSGTGTFLGHTYQKFITTDDSGPVDTAYFRKDNSGSYYQYSDTSGLGDIGISAAQPGFDVLFLKDVLTTGAVFNSDHPATFGGTSPITIRFKNTVIDANASITVNGKNFINVYKIELMIQAGLSGVFQDISLSPLTYYYAKDIGLIKITDGTDSQDIRYWKIN